MSWDEAVAAGTTDEPDGLPDTRIVPLVNELHRLGIRTYASCSGHPTTDGTARAGYLWIDRASLTDEQAAAIQRDPSIWWVRDIEEPRPIWHIAWFAENADSAFSAVRACVSPKCLTGKRALP